MFYKTVIKRDVTIMYLLTSILSIRVLHLLLSYFTTLSTNKVMFFNVQHGLLIDYDNIGQYQLACLVQAFEVFIVMISLLALSANTVDKSEGIYGLHQKFDIKHVGGRYNQFLRMNYLIVMPMFLTWALQKASALSVRIENGQEYHLLLNLYRLVRFPAKLVSYLIPNFDTVVVFGVLLLIGWLLTYYKTLPIEVEQPKIKELTDEERFQQALHSINEDAKKADEDTKNKAKRRAKRSAVDDRFDNFVS